MASVAVSVRELSQSISAFSLQGAPRSSRGGGRETVCSSLRAVSACRRYRFVHINHGVSCLSSNSINI